VLTGEAVQNVYHFASDALEHFLLRGGRVFLKIVPPPVQTLRELLSLGGEPCLFIFAEFSLACLELLLQIIDLLGQAVDFGGPRRKLRLQFRGRLLALRGGSDSTAQIDDGHRLGSRAGRGRRLCPGCPCAYEACCEQRSGSQNNSQIHFILLVMGDPDEIETNRSQFFIGLKVFRLPAPSAGTAQTPKYSEPQVLLQSESTRRWALPNSISRFQTFLLLVPAAIAMDGQPGSESRPATGSASPHA